MTGQVQTQQQLTGLARRIWPNFARLDERERLRRLSDLLGIAYALPFVVVGLVWLVRETNMFVIERAWVPLLVFALLGVVFDRRPFFWIEEPRAGRYERHDASLTPMIVVAVLLLFGPSALWIMVLSAVVALLWRYPRTASRTNRIRELRRRLLQIALTPALLAGAWMYSLVGGSYPLAQLVWVVAWPALVAIGIAALGVVLIYLGYLLLAGALGLRGVDEFELRRLVIQLLMLAAPAVFGILVATIYMQLGMVGLLFFGAAAMLASLAANQLSYTNLNNTQRTRELEQLEQLGRAIIGAPPDNSTLQSLLAAYVPFMFQHDQIDIVMFPDQPLLHSAVRPVPVDRAIWSWIAANPQSRAFRPNQPLPWNGTPAPYGMIIAPITNAAHIDPIGGIAIVLPRALSDQEREVESMLPAVQTLAAQIGSAVQSAEVFQQVRALDRLNQDLNVAATIQASFLPATLPERPGWQFAAQLRPARQTSGDFYDVFDLPNGKLGLVIADVADKGTGPALFMAVARTLIRTYASENPEHPDVVLWAANQRILSDSHSGLFVTVFYAVLDTTDGSLCYANAGHNPPLLMCSDGEIRQLRNTGIPLGIEEDIAWRAEREAIEAGDLFILYTDGVPEAQNSAGEFFGSERLLAHARSLRGKTAADAQANLLHELDAFVDAAPQYDDQTLMVVKRESVEAAKR